MSKGHGVITAEGLTLDILPGLSQTIRVELTPCGKFLTEATNRRILATGYLQGYGQKSASDDHFIEAFLECIRRQVLAYQDGKER